MKNVTSQPNGALKLATSLSLVLLLAGAWLVLCRWYPQPFWLASGVFGVATYAVFVHLGLTALLLLPWRNRSKDAADSVKADIGFIVFVMSGAALLSLSFLFAGRPVALIYAVDRVALVRANEVRTSELAQASHEKLRWSGPLRLLAARPSSDAERLDSIQLAMAGFDLHQRPGFWVDIQTQRDQVIAKARLAAELDGSISEKLAPPDGTQVRWAHYLPLAGVIGNWILLLDEEFGTFVPVKVE